MYIKRAIENIIKSTLEQFPIILLSGPRQVGKTTVLKEILNSNYGYITMDDLFLRNQIIEDTELFFKNNPGSLILDEIQYVTEVFPYLKKLVDENNVNGKFILTGSQSFKMMKGISESLAGRVGILELQGISLREKFSINFNEAFIPTEEYLSERKKHIVNYVNLWEIIHRGYMPKLISDENINWNIYYNSYVQTYIERDIRELTQVANINLFYKFLVSIASRSGELLNYQSIAKDLGITIDTIKRWLSVLESSNIIYLLYPYHNNHLKRAIKTPKIYFLDTGLLSYLTNWPNAKTLSNSMISGNIFETFVISEIIKSYINTGNTRPPLYFYRDKDKKEIDLIIEVEDKLYPIEIKETTKPSLSMIKSFDILKNISDKKIEYKTIICRRDKLTYLSDDVISIPIEYI